MLAGKRSPVTQEDDTFICDVLYLLLGEQKKLTVTQISEYLGLPGQSSIEKVRYRLSTYVSRNPNGLIRMEEHNVFLQE